MLHANEQKYKQRRQQESSHRNTCLSECWKLLVIEHHWPYLPKQTNKTFHTRSILNVFFASVYTRTESERILVKDRKTPDVKFWKTHETNLQSWTKVLGQICTFGVFTRTQVCECNFTCLISPPNPHTMLKTITYNFFWFLILYWVVRGNSKALWNGKQCFFFQTSIVK